jgi:hypothetical protein
MGTVITILLILFFILAYHKILLALRDYVKPQIKEWLKMFLDWKFGLCYLIAWAILHTPLYAGIILGAIFNIKWIAVLCSTIYAIYWTPFCNEYIIQIPIAMWLKKVFFSKDNIKSRFLLK